MGPTTSKTMKAFTFAIFLTLAVAFAAASEDTEIDDALLGHLDVDTEVVTDLESQDKTSWGHRRTKRYITRKHYRCHYNQNWVNGLKYSQKVIKASSRRAAAQMCVNDCAKRKGCTGFFYQKHKNGHQICGFYSSKIGAGTWHGHAEGAVCRHYKTTRHEVKGQEDEVAQSEDGSEDGKWAHLFCHDKPRGLLKCHYRGGRRTHCHAATCQSFGKNHCKAPHRSAPAMKKHCYRYCGFCGEE